VVPFDRFYHEVKSAGLLDPTVIRPQMPLQPSEPSPPSQAIVLMILADFKHDQRTQRRSATESPRGDPW